MTEETVLDTPVETTKPAKAPRTAAVLTLFAQDSTALPAPVLKYPMPVKAPRFNLTVNDQVVQAAQTAFKDKVYTYFQYAGVDFYVTGMLDQAVKYTFTVPEGYVFTPLKLDRKAQADAASAKAKAKKADPSLMAPGSEESPPEGSETATEGGSTSSTENGPESASTPVAPKGKKAKR